MDCPADVSVILLPIQPRYAQPIIEGHKTVEFRKTNFRTSPSYAVIYASSPVQQVIGYFEVKAVTVAPVETLWERYSAVGCIGPKEFAEYYGDRDSGLVLEVGDVTVLEHPVSLADLGLSSRPPQSFMYVPNSVIKLLDRRVAGAQRAVG